MTSSANYVEGNDGPVIFTIMGLINICSVFIF